MQSAFGGPADDLLQDALTFVQTNSQLFVLLQRLHQVVLGAQLLFRLKHDDDITLADITDKLPSCRRNNLGKCSPDLLISTQLTQTTAT